MSRIDDLITKLCPHGVRYRSLSESSVAHFRTGAQLNRSELSDSGEFPVYNGGVASSGRHSVANAVGPAIIVSQGGASAGYVNFIVSPFWAGAHCYVVTPGDEIEQRFLYFALKAKQRQIQGSALGAGIPGLSRTALGAVKIPVPPREVQNEVVRVLDRFTALEAELEAELEARRLQYEHYRRRLLHLPSAPKVAISELVHGVPSGRNKSRVEEGRYPVYGSTGQIGTTNEPVYNSDALLIARVGANAGRVNSVSGEYDVSDNTLILNPKPDWNVRFAFHQLTAMNLNQYAVGGGQPLITGRLLKSLEVALPTSAEQQELAAVLDKFDALVNDMSVGLPAELAARRKQYEYYRDKLLTFPEAAS
ncbi:MAG: restriction endonuclease subunit S [Actinobacteria bacterium HGW-Actinobacteria-11]|nr:MAG: restriction endonuclease subunit S [Actinobacteria bacterium HGW-Actinobacteria-11]